MNIGWTTIITALITGAVTWLTTRSKSQVEREETFASHTPELWDRLDKVNKDLDETKKERDLLRFKVEKLQLTVNNQSDIIDRQSKIIDAQTRQLKELKDSVDDLRKEVTKNEL